MERKAEGAENHAKPDQTKAESSKNKNQRAMDTALKETIRREKLQLAKLKHDQKMNEWFEQQKKNESKNNKKKPAKTETNEEGEEAFFAAHPDDMLLSDDEISLASEISEELEIGTGGATKPIWSLPSDTFISTWTYVVPAAVYHASVAWRSVNENGDCEFDKEKCHKSFRKLLRNFCRRMKWHVCWQLGDLHSACFEESSSKAIKVSDLKPFTNQRSTMGSDNGLNHCHILVQYEGNSKRGTMVRIVDRLTQYLNDHDFLCYGYTIYDDSLPRPLHASREKQQTYLLTCQYGFCLLVWFLIGRVYRVVTKNRSFRNNKVRFKSTQYIWCSVS